MRTFRIATALAVTVAGVLSLPVLAQENKPSATTTQVTTAPQVTPAPPAEKPAETKPPAKKPEAAPPPLQIKVGDNISFRFGIRIQPQLDFSQNAAGKYEQNLQVRRLRFLVGGQLAKDVFFFWETENSRLGGVSGGNKVISTGFQNLASFEEVQHRGWDAPSSDLSRGAGELGE